VTRAWIGLGANLGDPIATLRAARERLIGLGAVAAVSSLYRTPAWGVTEQPPFVNAALALDTTLAPYDLLAALKALEVDLGRVASFRWGPRAIDLDILDYAGVRLDDPQLTIPHARLFERAFALVPLAEIAPAYAAARDALPAADLAAIERIGPLEGEGSRR
jgi:2-amino-4-hydroxy-6-hydroxymethyldihydropteridine diphosphokinase